MHVDTCTIDVKIFTSEKDCSMKIKALIRISIDFTAEGFTTLPPEESVRVIARGEISCPTMPRKGDEIVLSDSIINAICMIPTRLSFVGGRAPRMEVVEAYFKLDERNVAHPEICCTLQLCSDFTRIPRFVKASKIVSEFIATPFAHDGFNVEVFNI